MPRPKLSPLSSLLPAKGAATRPEPVSRAGEHANVKASLRESLSASDDEVRANASEQSSEHESKQATVPASKRTSLLVTGHKDGSRSAVSFRMTEGLQERLRLYAFETRRSKQDVLDDALHEYLLREGH